MPDHIKGLVVILILASTFFAFAKQPSCTIIEAGDFTRRRNVWLAITLAAFLSPNFWVYTFIAVLLLFYANRRETNPPALFYFILFTMPNDVAQIPGLGIFNALFELSHARILELVILLPAFLSLRRQSDTLSIGRAASDKFLVAFLLLGTVLYLRDANVTSTMRHAFYLFFDIFLPYIVFSRSLKNIKAFRDVLLSFVLATMVLALIAGFEFSKHWLLYQPLSSSLQMESGMTSYLGREGMLRVVASAGQPIVLGYLMVVGIGLYLFLQQNIKQKLMRRFGMVLLAVGLFAPLSRGPWIGAVVLLFVFIATGRNSVRRLMSWAFAAMLALPLIAVLPEARK